LCRAVVSVYLNVDAEQCNYYFILTGWSTMQQSRVHNEMNYNCVSLGSSLCVSLLMNIIPCNVRLTVIILRNVASNDANFKTFNFEGNAPCQKYQHPFHCPKHNLRVRLFEELLASFIGRNFKLVSKRILQEFHFMTLRND
jgi:hypothetical protein